MNYVFLKENHYFLQKTSFAKRGRGATLIKAIFYSQVGSVALLFVLIPKLLLFLFFYLFIYLPYFILHSRESELYRYTLDGKSALAWELPFLRFMGHLSST